MKISLNEIIHFDLLVSQMHYYNRKASKTRASFVRTIKNTHSQTHTISKRKSEENLDKTKCKVIETNNYNKQKTFMKQTHI